MQLIYLYRLVFRKADDFDDEEKTVVNLLKKFDPLLNNTNNYDNDKMNFYILNLLFSFL